MDILNEVNRRAPFYRFGKRPSTLKAAAEYINCFLEGRWVNQQELARRYGITSVALRNRVKDMARILGIENQLQRAYASVQKIEHYSHH